jgi:hypothetical protein
MGRSTSRTLPTSTLCCGLKLTPVAVLISVLSIPKSLPFELALVDISADF